MKKLFFKVLSLALCLSVAAGFSASAAAESEPSVEPQSTVAIRQVSVNLSDSGSKLYLNFNIQATAACSSLGVSSVTLFDTTTGKSTNYPGKTTSGVSYYQDQIKMSGVSGHSYYALVSFIATPYSGSSVRSSAITDTIKL